MDALAAIVADFLAETAHANRPGVVAVSGGADSVALARALHCLKVPIVVTHFNHQLRGAESDGDEAFVRNLAQELSCEFQLGTADVRAAGGNLEAAARQMRYDWLEHITPPGTWIATAHTANDQAETILHRLLRGTGLQGLRGIAATRGRILRPMLTVRRSQVLEYLQQLGQGYRTDSTNADTRLTRNRIRAELLPMLESFSPEIVASLGRIAEQSTETFRALELETIVRLATIERPRADNVIVLDAARLANEPAFWIRELLRHLWHREGWPTDAMNAAAWQRVAAVARGHTPAVDCPGGVRVRHAGRVVHLACGS